ncbi:hypothetical protein BGZ65_003103, partial [Modicella reniformis]
MLDLKLMGPEGSVYTEFSYTFVKENSKSKNKTANESSAKVLDDKDRSSKPKTRERTSHTTTLLPSKSELDTKVGAEHDEFGEDYEEAMTVGSTKQSALDVVAEEPDAGEHFMQATSQFFSRMGYWLYNSKVVQYIARDDRVRTKTAFSADDIWMLGVCYTFEQQQLQLQEEGEKVVEEEEEKAIEDSVNDAGNFQQHILSGSQELDVP